MRQRGSDAEVGTDFADQAQAESAEEGTVELCLEKEQFGKQISWQYNADSRYVSGAGSRSPLSFHLLQTFELYQSYYSQLAL